MKTPSIPGLLIAFAAALFLAWPGTAFADAGAADRTVEMAREKIAPLVMETARAISGSYFTDS